MPAIVDTAAQVQAALGSTYRIDRELEGGGTALVFVAHEPELGRHVAVKALTMDVAAHLDAERFRREMRYVARLQHPLIVPLLSSGESHGVLYYTMPFVDGESLRDRLAREPRLTFRETTCILHDVAEALAYAHAHGVVHRDIKPGNVLLTHSHALVTDFGVAKALSTTMPGWRSVTAAGMTLGTAAYMAPEQVLGEANLDHRADIYSFGALAYEMVTGRPPFSAPTTSAMLAAHVAYDPIPIERVRPDLPAAFARLVMRCLEKDPRRRWQSAAALLEELAGIEGSASGARMGMVRRLRGGGGLAAMISGHPIPSAVVSALLAAGLLVLNGAVAAELSLPHWAESGVRALVLIGFGVVLATTARVPAWLSWRRALQAGVIAWALWGLAVSFYFVARATGMIAR